MRHYDYYFDMEDGEYIRVEQRYAYLPGPNGHRQPCFTKPIPREGNKKNKGVKTCLKKKS